MAKMWMFSSISWTRAAGLAAVFPLWLMLWLSQGTALAGALTLLVLLALPFRNRTVSILVGSFIAAILTVCVHRIAPPFHIYGIRDQNVLAALIAGGIGGEVSWWTNEDRIQRSWDPLVVVLYSIAIWLLVGMASSSMLQLFRALPARGTRVGELVAMSSELAFVLLVASLPAAIVLGLLPAKRFVILASTSLVLILPTLGIAFVLSAVLFFGPFVFLRYLSVTKAIFLFVWAIGIAMAKRSCSYSSPEQIAVS